MESEHIEALIDRSDQHKHKPDKAIFTGVRSVSILESDELGTVYVFEEESLEFWPSYLIISSKEFDLLLDHLENFIASDDDTLSLNSFKCTYGDILELWKEKVLFLTKVIVIRCVCERKTWSFWINEEVGTRALKRIRQLKPQANQ